MFAASLHPSEFLRHSSTVGDPCSRGTWFATHTPGPRASAMPAGCEDRAGRSRCAWQKSARLVQQSRAHQLAALLGRIDEEAVVVEALGQGHDPVLVPGHVVVSAHRVRRATNIRLSSAGGEAVRLDQRSRLTISDSMMLSSTVAHDHEAYLGLVRCLR